jgi:hypothetical protein
MVTINLQQCRINNSGEKINPKDEKRDLRKLCAGKLTVFRIVALCSVVEIYRRFRDASYLHHQDY